MVPQTVENLQHIMALDAVRMQKQDETIARRDRTINSLRQKLAEKRAGKPDKGEEHWHSFAFMWVEKGTETHHANAKAGFPDRKITNPHLKELKKSIGAPESAVLLSASYLGYMTEDELTGDQSNDTQ